MNDYSDFTNLLQTATIFVGPDTIYDPYIGNITVPVGPSPFNPSPTPPGPTPTPTPSNSGGKKWLWILLLIILLLLVLALLGYMCFKKSKKKEPIVAIYAPINDDANNSFQAVISTGDEGP